MLHLSNLSHSTDFNTEHSQHFCNFIQARFVKYVPSYIIIYIFNTYYEKYHVEKKKKKKVV